MTYKRHCNNCGKYYKGRGKLHCSRQCNSQGKTNPRYGIKLSKEIREKISKATRGRMPNQTSFRKGWKSLENHPQWKGGIKKSRGYILLRMPEHPYCNKSGYFFVHRYYAECFLGRFIEKNEIVHHIDNNPENNLPENLYLFSSNSEHSKFHKSPYPLKSNLL